jgi:hypothetical protein
MNHDYKAISEEIATYPWKEQRASYQHYVENLLRKHFEPDAIDEAVGDAAEVYEVQIKGLHGFLGTSRAQLGRVTEALTACMKERDEILIVAQDRDKVIKWQNDKIATMPQELAAERAKSARLEKALEEVAAGCNLGVAMDIARAALAPQAEGAEKGKS